MKESFEEMLEAIRKVRKLSPWVSKVTSEEYSKEIVDEANEVIEAIKNKDNKNLQEELGDLLWDLLTLINIAEEEGKIDSKEVIKEVIEKIKRRKPYVFEGKTVSREEARKIWNDVKKKEKEGIK